MLIGLCARRPLFRWLECHRESAVSAFEENLDPHSFRAVEHFYCCRFLLGTPFQPMLIRGPHKPAEQRMRLQRLRLEFRMKLAADEVRMIGEFHHLNVSPVQRRPRDAQSSSHHGLLVLAVELVAMPVPLADFQLPVDLVCQRVGFDLARPSSQPHRATQFFYTSQFAQLVDYAMRRRWIELARVRLCQSHHVAGELNTSRLHAEANPKVRNFILARVTNCEQHAFYAALAESSGDQNPVIAFQLRLVTLVTVCAFQAFGLNPVD